MSWSPINARDKPTGLPINAPTAACPTVLLMIAPVPAPKPAPMSPPCSLVVMGDEQPAANMIVRTIAKPNLCFLFIVVSSVRNVLSLLLLLTPPNHCENRC
jgi:hypothetical protein